METLKEAEKQMLISQEPTRSAKYICDAIIKYDNLSLDDFPNMASDKRDYIQRELDSRPVPPNPQEKSEWSAIERGGLIGRNVHDLSIEELRMFETQLNDYIAHWRGSRPGGNHLYEAEHNASIVSNEILERERERERQDWNSLCSHTASFGELRSYLQKYPNSSHKAELDSMVWSAVCDNENEETLDFYLNNFPEGSYIYEAREKCDILREWYATDKNDIFNVAYYCQNHRVSPNSEPMQVFENLKRSEMHAVNTPNYPANRLSELMRYNVFTESELLSAGVPRRLVEKVKGGEDIQKIDLIKAMEESSAECVPGYTDIYFLGVPHTGKTCVLIGLTQADGFKIDYTSAGDPYAQALNILAERGEIPGQTPGTFTTAFAAKVNSKYKNKIVDHEINVVEMSGEEFAFDIVQRPDRVCSFETMGGRGVLKLLNNGNSKLFFLIVDPTAMEVTIDRETEHGLEYVVVNQRLVLRKMMDMFAAEENADIMRMVDSMHIIVTKADTFNHDENEAIRRVKEIYREVEFNDIVKLCKKYNINSNTEFKPHVYTFSLGRFFGEFFEYEPEDSNKLVEVIANSTHGKKGETFIDMFKDKVN